MTPQALRVVRTFLDAAAAENLTGISDCVDPDVVWRGTRGGLDEGLVLRGPHALIEYLREIREPWQRYEVETRRLLDAGDMVVALLSESAHARSDDLEVETRTAMVFKVREQKIVEATGYLDPGEALRAVGLSR